MEQEKNYEKNQSYRTQISRLNKALKNEFFLEAIFIEYSIIEDRTSAILRYGGTKVKARNEGEPPSLQKKLNKIDEISGVKNSFASRYFNHKMIEEIKAWKDVRNGLIHDLLNQKVTTEQLQEYALEGERIAKLLNKNSQLYKGMIQRHEKENNNE